MKSAICFQDVIGGTYLKVKAKNLVDDLQPIFNYSCLAARILNKIRAETNIVELE